MNLLVVDDEYYIVQGILSAINQETLHFDSIFTAYSADQARKIIEKEQVDILVTDLEMPRENGLSLIRWIRENKYTMVILILTGHQRFDYAQKALSMRCFSYILKPVDRISLNQELQRAAASIAPVLPLSAMENIPASSYEQDDDFIKKVRDFILANLDSQELNRNSISAHVHMNPDYLSYAFHARFGQTLSAYITQVRIDKAKELLLTTSLSLNEISEKTGFSTSSYFHKQFKRATGLTPSQYRTR